MSQMHLQEVQPNPAPRRWGAAFAAAAVVVVLVVVAGGVGLLARNGNGNPGGVVAPVATPSAQPTPAATAAPAPAVAPGPTPAAFRAGSSCTVSTLAGTPGQTGSADGAGAAARFGEEGVSTVFGPDGRVYMSDRANHIIRVMTRDGVVTTIAGKAGEPGSVDGRGSVARFNRPTGGAFDAAGNFYVADTDANTIRRIAPDGMVTTIAGKAGQAGTTDGVGAAARFTEPIVGAVDAADNIYVGSMTDTTVRRIAPDGTVTTIAGKAGETGMADGVGTAARFNNPWFVGLDAQGVLWINDVLTSRLNSTLRKMTPDGTVTTVKSDWGFGAPFGLWFAPSGAIYYTSYLNDAVAMLTADGREVLLAGGPHPEGAQVDGPGNVATFSGPTGIARDAAGLLYVSDAYDGTIRTIRCDVGGGFPAGSWTRPLPSGGDGVMEFRPDGTWSYAIRGEAVSSGTYSTDDATLAFKTDTMCAEQAAEQGTYAWTYANGQLMFTKLDDACAVGRATTFDGSAWTPVR